MTAPGTAEQDTRRRTTGTERPRRLPVTPVRPDAGRERRLRRANRAVVVDWMRRLNEPR